MTEAFLDERTLAVAAARTCFNAHWGGTAVGDQRHQQPGLERIASPLRCRWRSESPIPFWGLVCAPSAPDRISSHRGRIPTCSRPGWRDGLGKYLPSSCYLCQDSTLSGSNTPRSRASRSHTRLAHTRLAHTHVSRAIPASRTPVSFPSQHQQQHDAASRGQRAIGSRPRRRIAGLRGVWRKGIATEGRDPAARPVPASAPPVICSAASCAAPDVVMSEYIHASRPQKKKHDRPARTPIWPCEGRRARHGDE